MIVEEIMSKNVVTLQPEDTIQKSIEVMRDFNIRHIPIVDQNQLLVGLISTQDIRSATPSIFHATDPLEDFQKPISTIMKTNVITGHPLDFVDEIAFTFYTHKIGCVPILKEKKLVGILSETDLLHTFVKLTGAHKPGSQIQVKAPNKPGILSDITSIFKTKNALILSILMYPDIQDENFNVIVIKVQTMNPLSIVTELRNNDFEVLWPKTPGSLS